MKTASFIIALSLIATSCGLGGSDVLSACGGPTDETVDRQPGDAEGFAIEFSEQVYQPDSIAAFTWKIPNGDVGTVGDEWMVECWDGESWKDAWMATGVFPGNAASFVFLDGDVIVTDDGFDATDGRSGAIAIPGSTPDGEYRVREIVSFPDRSEVRATFVVLAN